MMKLWILALGLGAAALTLSFARANQDQRLVVVELFTSQGCSSCPPADEILGTLTGQADVLPLSMPVDYWDNLGWKDTLARPEFTQRQRAYAAQLGANQVYTPQAIVDGTLDVVGSRRQAMLAAIDARRNQPAAARLTLTRTASGLALGVMPTSGAPAGDLILLRYRKHAQVSVRRGENGGRALDYWNVVSDMRVVSSFRGTAMTLEVPIDPPGADEGAAVILQAPRTGAILAAAILSK